MLVIDQVDRADMTRLCQAGRALLERSEAGLLVCDMAGLGEPDAVAVDILARLQLTARRLGREVRVRHACHELRDLLELAGLAEVVRCEDLALEPGGQTEQGEQPSGVQEERDPADPVP